MVDPSLLPAIRAALRENEIGNQSPYVLSYAELGNSGGSFGVFQGDACVDPNARAALKQVLVAANVNAATIESYRQCSQPALSSRKSAEPGGSTDCRHRSQQRAGTSNR